MLLLSWFSYCDCGYNFTIVIILNFYLWVWICRLCKIGKGYIFSHILFPFHFDNQVKYSWLCFSSFFSFSLCFCFPLCLKCAICIVHSSFTLPNLLMFFLIYKSYLFYISLKGFYCHILYVSNFSPLKIREKTNFVRLLSFEIFLLQWWIISSGEAYLKGRLSTFEMMIRVVKSLYWPNWKQNSGSNAWNPGNAKLTDFESVPPYNNGVLLSVFPISGKDKI